MFEELNRRLIEARQAQRERLRLERQLVKVQGELDKEEKRLLTLQNELQAEEKDVKKLEGLSLSGLFYTILGSKEKQMEKERQEYLAFKLRYDECSRLVEALRKEAGSIKNQIGRIRPLERSLEDLLEEKEKLIRQEGGEGAARLSELSEQLADARSDLKEIQEAINAGNSVLLALNDVLSSLDSADSWGTWDLLGGGLISTAIKHSKIDDARDAASHVQHLLR